MIWILGTMILAAGIAVYFLKFRLKGDVKDTKDEGKEARVYRLVQEKKAKAKELRLPEFMADLFFDQIVHYPVWMNGNERKDLVPLEVKFAEEIKDQGSAKKQVKLGISRDVYVFGFESQLVPMPNGSSENRGLLELYFNDRKVLAIELSCEKAQFGIIWNPYDLQAFIEGPWIRVFRDLRQHTVELNRKKDKKSWDSPQKIKDLKNNFNIE